MGVQIAVRCNFCSRQVAPHAARQMGAHGQVICDRCLDWHAHAIQFLNGTAEPRGCQECGKTFEALRVSAPAVELDVRMYVVPKDGIYALLCEDCAQRYLPKRRDLYAGTAYGHQSKIA